MILLVGASASGKTELAKYLVEYYSFRKTITSTTRKIRFNETNDVDYHFLSDDDFVDKLKTDSFLEYTTYNNSYYGLLKSDIRSDGVVILEPSGANKLINYLAEKDLFVVYIEANKDTRGKRMLARLDNKKDIEKRIELDNELFTPSKLDRIDLILNNDNTTIIDLAKKVHEEYIKHTK